MLNDDEKIGMIVALSGCQDVLQTEYEFIATCLEVAKREIVSWRGLPACAEVPEEYEMTQIYAVIAGYSQSGAEGQLSHSENGIGRTFRHADMIDYIRAHVLPLVKVI